QPAPEPQPRNWPDAPPGRPPADRAGAPDTIMAPPSPPPPYSGGRDGTTNGAADGGASHGAGHGAGRGASEQADDEAGGASFRCDLDVPPF
ncbi:hypothetical protein AB0J37_37355, partial [Microbispora rosea]